MKEKGMAIRKSPKKKIIILVAVLLVVVVGVAACSRLAAAGRAPAPLSATALAKTDLESSVSVSGTIDSVDSENVYTTLTYPVKDDGGDTVKAGDVLAVLDTADLERDITAAENSTTSANESARLALEKAQSAYENAQYLYNNNLNTELLNAQDAANSAKRALDKAQSDYSYNEFLYNAGEISQQEMIDKTSARDEAQSQFDIATAALTATQRKVDQDLAMAKNSYETALAAYNDKSADLSLERQRQRLADAQITAPVDGTVTVSNAVVGAPASGVLFMVEDLNGLEIDVDIKEFDVGQVAVGKKAVIKTDATGHAEIPGEVSMVAPAATPETQGTGSVSFKAKISVTGENTGLKVGMKARVSILLDERINVYAVPYEAVVTKDDGSSVIYTAVPSAGDGAKPGRYTSQEIPVTKGLENDLYIEVSGDGLSDGLLVIDSPDAIPDGEFTLDEG